ncbi:acetyl-CoA synthetase-like protein [Pleurotus eryngii]|uniref:Acetyl-CoA synthetase-like protein n=1 Tax=Pleurotus eryngii TaxID=5323 RepID=A0A9P6A546_PLEER|nr:acetyl-CoA synthetase-like protein [Pleurotus eryngii]
MSSSHLTVLETSASVYPSASAFKLPQLDESNNIAGWQSITYSQFQHDVERFARSWSHKLRSSGVPRRSIVGLWLGGMTYTDVLHIYGLSRAGYIPQMFSLRLPNPAVVCELLEKAGANALIYDATFASTLSEASVPIHVAMEYDEADPLGEPLPERFDNRPEDLAFIFHTSGSTSGSPKLVPCSFRWLESAVKKSYQVSKPINASKQDVTVWMGSMCHIGQTFMLLGTLQHGSCVIQPTAINFSSEELHVMIQDCGLNRLNQFATFLANHLRKSRQDPKLLSKLVDLDEILYSGLPLAREEEQWAYHHGMKIRNLFGSTECGAMLLSVGGRDHTAPFLRPLEGVHYGFEPIAPVSPSEAAHQSTGRMYELVIYSDSGDCPDASLRHSEDGHFHTGDLFQEPIPGAYVFRGRDDDWIKSENSLRCDTKAIEDNVRAMCGSLIDDCIVVGTGRPSPVLFVEPTSDIDHEKLKKEIIRKTRQFHARRYLHERITSTKMIVVVPRKALPRTATKGNIRRKAVEEAYKSQIDSIFGVSR